MYFRANIYNRKKVLFYPFNIFQKTKRFNTVSSDLYLIKY